MHLKLNHTPYYAYTANQQWTAARDMIVFVHGAAMDHSVWSHQSRYFAYHGYNVAAVDLPGHNLSGGKPLHEIAASGDWLNRILAMICALSGGRHVHLVGHSMGALIALECAAILTSGAQHAKLKSKAKSKAKPKTKTAPAATLQSLSLVGFSYPMRVTPQLLDAAQNNPSAAYAMMTQWSHASKIGGEPLPGFWSPGLQMSMMENSNPKALFADLTACNQYVGGEPDFAELRAPILFICGARDRMAPAKLAAAHAEKNAAAEIVFLPQCGHNLMSESPDGVLRELKRFIGKHQTT